jgi:hypothetical protein
LTHRSINREEINDIEDNRFEEIEKKFERHIMGGMEKVEFNEIKESYL